MSLSTSQGFLKSFFSNAFFEQWPVESEQWQVTSGKSNRNTSKLKTQNSKPFPVPYSLSPKQRACNDGQSVSSALGCCADIHGLRAAVLAERRLRRGEYQRRW